MSLMQRCPYMYFIGALRGSTVCKELTLTRSCLGVCKMLGMERGGSPT